MLTYVEKAKEEYIKLIWDGIRKASQGRKSHIVERATVEFLKLYVASKPLPVNGDVILRNTKFSAYKNPNSHGLWPWLPKNNNAGVIEQEKDNSGKWVYGVREEFYETMCEVILGPNKSKVKQSEPQRKVKA